MWKWDTWEIKKKKAFESGFNQEKKAQKWERLAWEF